MTGPVHQRLLDARRDAPGLLWLVDPDKIDPHHPDPRWERAAEYGVTALLVGTSQDGKSEFSAAVSLVRCRARLPVILFPGSAMQVTRHADAILFLTLLSGRNPEYLVGQQVKGAPRVREYGLETIPTGYLLIDTGSTTSVARHSGTTPLHEDDADGICAHALCAQYMGQAFVYLEAGSGARRPVPSRVITAVRETLSIPLIVGGGLRTPEMCGTAVAAGADFVVVGTALEIERSADALCDMVAATRRVTAAPSRRE